MAILWPRASLLKSRHYEATVAVEPHNNPLGGHQPGVPERNDLR